MAQKLYIAKFHYDLPVWPESKQLFEKAYNIMRNEACNRINPMFEVWNNEYGEVKDLDDYNHYIQAKEQTILDELNNQMNESPVKLYADDEADIIGKFRDVFFKYEVTMRLTLEPYKN